MRKAPSIERVGTPDPAVALLAVGSEEEDLLYLRNICQGVGWKLHEARDLRHARAEMHQKLVSVLLCQDKLPDGDWTDLLDPASGPLEAPYLIVWSRRADNSLWAEVLNLGGYDVLAAPFRVTEVVHTIGAAVRRWHEQGATRSRPKNRIASRDAVSSTPAAAA